MPSYPDALRGSGRAGLVVAALEIAADGRPERVTIAEAAHAAFGAAVVDALKQWRFEAVRLGPSPMPSPMRGKLVFYFRPDGTVFSPTYPSSASTRAAFASRDGEGHVRAVSWRDAAAQRAQQTAVIVALDPAAPPVLSEREARVEGAALNGIMRIPLKDLGVRARAELRPATAVLLCRHRDAALAARVLRIIGFADVGVVEGCPS
jgi:TonB family protein